MPGMNGERHMEWIKSAVSHAGNVISTIGVADIIDILIVAYLIYRTIWFVRRTNSFNLARGVLLLLAVLGLSEIFGLHMLSFLLRKAMELGLIALVILFQPELRRMLERMGSSFSMGKGAVGTVMDAAIAQTVLSCKDMAESKTGALIIFERKIALNDIMSTGTIINSDVTAELIKNIFFNKAPLHDGALIIRDGRIAAAGCVLPLTHSTNLSKDLGMRHRAGIGLSEQSDALVVIVSEETGAISLAIEGQLKRHLNAAALTQLLHNELVVDEEKKTMKDRLLEMAQTVIKRNRNGEDQSKKNII